MVLFKKFKINIFVYEFESKCKFICLFDGDESSKCFFFWCWKAFSLNAILNIFKYLKLIKLQMVINHVVYMFTRFMIYGHQI
jgi:hypothetical protein